MTKSKAIANHRRMWTWIADNTKRKKQIVWKGQYFAGQDEYPISYCYCCEYAFHMPHNKKMCGNCPLIWGGAEDKMCRDNEFEDWIKATCEDDWEKAEKCARIIANLPERR